MRRLLVTTCATVALVAAGCRSDYGTPPTQTSLAGVWNLSTVNGSPLPYVLQESGPRIELMRDQFVIYDNGTFTESTVGRVTDGATESTVTAPYAGTYTLSATFALFTFSNRTSARATVSGNTFTVASGGATQVYTKR